MDHPVGAGETLGATGLLAVLLAGLLARPSSPLTVRAVATASFSKKPGWSRSVAARWRPERVRRAGVVTGRRGRGCHLRSAGVELVGCPGNPGGVGRQGAFGTRRHDPP